MTARRMRPPLSSVGDVWVESNQEDGSARFRLNHEKFSPFQSSPVWSSLSGL